MRNFQGIFSCMNTNISVDFQICISVPLKEFMSLSQKHEEKARKFFFFARHRFKAELYCYIYIVIFGKQLSKIN